MRALDVDISKSHVASTSSVDLVFPLEGSSGSHVQNARSIDDDTHRSEGRLPSVQEPLSKPLEFRVPQSNAVLKRTENLTPTREEIISTGNDQRLVLSYKDKKEGTNAAQIQC